MPPLRLLISPTAFKGTLTPWETARQIAKAIRNILPRASLKLLPLADGGDGTLEVILKQFKGKLVRTWVHGPLGELTQARWGIINKNLNYKGPVGIIEMAEASGLRLLKNKNRILEATSYGTGELIRAALNKRCRTLLIGVGGTATSDGGAGALQALGLKYIDKSGSEISSQPEDLIRLTSVDWSGLDPRVKKAKIIVLCDVTNPLLGPHGSARTFGPQKGASPKEVEFLEKFLGHWSRFGPHQKKFVAGSGAAGALAFGLSSFLGARLVQGAPMVMKILGWSKFVRQVDLIITGEGRLDKTSFSGKIIGEVLKQKGRSKVYVVCGSTPLSKRIWQQKGINKLAKMGPAGLKNPKNLLANSSARLF